jgi:hypothetical protein
MAATEQDPGSRPRERMTMTDEMAIALVYALAAQDPDFLADDEAVRQDFAALDREMDEVIG